MLYSKKIAVLFCVINLFSSLVCASSISKVAAAISSDKRKFCNDTHCFFPGKNLTTEDIIIDDQISWDEDEDLVLHTQGNIIFKKSGKIVSKKSSVILKSGMMPRERDVYGSDVRFEGDSPQIEVLETGKVKIYYNPAAEEGQSKYCNPKHYSEMLPDVKLEAHMLINNVKDLQEIKNFLHGAYALSQDIDAAVTQEWNDGEGFAPIKGVNNDDGFTGIFDGNNYSIKNLYINRPEEEWVGLFGSVKEVDGYTPTPTLKDFTVEKAFIRGKRYAGVVLGCVAEVKISNVNVYNSKIMSDEGDLGGLGGRVLVNRHKNLGAKGVSINGVMQNDNASFFGSCVGCTEVLSEHLVEVITDDEDIFCNSTDCFFPSKKISDYDLVIEDQINWNKDKNLVIHTKGDISFEGAGKIISEKDGSIVLKSGMEPGKKREYKKAVEFGEKDNYVRIEMLGRGDVKIYYNPVAKEEGDYRFHNPRDYSYGERIKFPDGADKGFVSYMLVNNVVELQNIYTLFHMPYALSQDVDATNTRNWYKGKGFQPLTVQSDKRPFVGSLDGNGYVIKNLFINRPDEDEVGLFAKCAGDVRNVVLDGFDITGDHYVGSLAGISFNHDVSNVTVRNSTIKSRDVVGGLIGTASKINARDIRIAKDVKVAGEENVGFVIGSTNTEETIAELLVESEEELTGIMQDYSIIGYQSDNTKMFVKVQN